jgi:hypothetical protein
VNLPGRVTLPSTAREREGERVVVSVSPELVVLLLSRTDRTKRYATLFVLLYFLYFVFRNALQARRDGLPSTPYGVILNTVP